MSKRGKYIVTGVEVFLEMRVHENSKMVEIWLSNAEKNDPAVREKLAPVCKDYRNKKYLVAVFESGDKDLCEETAALLLSSRRRAAEREVRAQRSAGMSMGM